MKNSLVAASVVRKTSLTPAASSWLLVLIFLALISSVPAKANQARSLDSVQALLDAGDLEQASATVQRYIKQNPGDARAVLLRSTIRFLRGDLKGGKADLEAALRQDPTLRQGWLNRAGLAVSEGDYDQALAYFERARALDPSNTDSDLNTGAVLLLKGDLGAAAQRFGSYLAAEPTANGHFLVATNYASQDFPDKALEHLSTAIRLNERIRLRARTEANFFDLAQDRRFQKLLSMDSFQPSTKFFSDSLTFEDPYEGSSGALLTAVLEAMRGVKEPFDPTVEATDDWAIVWGDLRIKIYDRPGKDEYGVAIQVGVVEISAPVDSMEESQFRARVERLSRQIESNLIRIAGI